MRWDGGGWSALGSDGGNGANGWVSALAVSGSELFVGGEFTAVGGIAAYFVARWDGHAWSALGHGGGNGVGGTVHALAVSGSDLYVGGDFAAVNLGAEIAATNIVRWDGSAWSAVGSSEGQGVNGPVWATAVIGGELYVGGSFTQANVGAAIPAHRVARWDGSVWSALGSDGGHGVNDTVYAMVASGSDLYVGGSFTQANVGAAIPVSRVARWDGSVWSALGHGGGNGVAGTVFALAVSSGDLYAGGDFTEANVGAGIVANRIASWDGDSWSSLGSGVGNGTNGTVRALATTGNDVFVGGDFTEANVGDNVSASRIARWNGSTWSALGSGTSDVVRSLTMQNRDALFVAGGFRLAGNKPSSYIGRYDRSDVFQDGFED